MVIFIRSFNEADVASIRNVYAQAFSGAPWFEALTDEQLRERWLASYHQPGFVALVAQDGKEVVGSHWRETMSAAEIAENWGEELCRFAQEFLRHQPACPPDRIMAHPDGEIIWERHLSVAPAWQNKGIGTMLRRTFLECLRFAEGNFLVLTRMRADNFASIRTAEKVGFRRTGVSRPSRSTPTTKHEFWYCFVRGRRACLRSPPAQAGQAENARLAA